VAALRAGYRSDLRSLLLESADPTATVALRGRESRDGRETDVIEVISAAEGRRLVFLDTTSHHVVAMEYNDGGRSALRIYRDMREVNGILWPFYEERLLDGIPVMSFTLTKVAFNTGVKDAEFRRPGSAPEPEGGAPARRPRPR